jgi:hypothetical protein
MAVRTNLGKIKSAIQEGRRAFSTIDFGPEIPSVITYEERAVSDWGAQIIDPNLFVAGVHNWGDTTLRVTK